MAGSVCALQPSTEEAISLLLPRKLAKAFRLLPAYARRSLLLQHDCRGRPLLPTIEAEALLAQRVEKELRKRYAHWRARGGRLMVSRLHLTETVVLMSFVRGDPVCSVTGRVVPYWQIDHRGSLIQCCCAVVRQGVVCVMHIHREI